MTDSRATVQHRHPALEALFEVMVLAAPAAFACHDLDGRYVCVSRALADLHRRSISDHLARLPTEVLPTQLGRDVEAMVRHVLDGGDQIRHTALIADIPDWGGVRHLETQWLPVRAAEGALVGVAVFVNDITDRRESEEALRRSQAHTTRLQMVTAELATAVTVDEVIAIIASVGRFTVGADRSEVILLDRYEPSFGRPGSRLPGRPAVPPSLPAAVAVAVREARPLYLANPAELTAAARSDGGPAPDVDVDMLATGERSWAILPLVSSGGPIGALRFSFGREQYVDTDDRVFLEALAGQCTLALERARLYDREHRAAVALQRSLLPETLPEVAGLQITYRYLPGAADVEVGGDWYDAFRLPGGQVAAVVGDVIGKGLSAAAGMGRVRSALRALAFTDSRPAAVLTGLDRLFAATEQDESLTTLVYAVVEPATGQVQMADAGHLPLVVLAADGDAQLVEATPASLPLGLAEPRRQQTLSLRPGDTLVGFSDGLVENRLRGLDEGLALLLEAVSGHGGMEVDRLVDRLVGRLLVGQERDDDVTVLALRISAAGAPNTPVV